MKFKTRCFFPSNLSSTDLSKDEKFATIPSLQVRRRSRIVFGENDDDDSSRASASSIKSKGPEFILNSSLPCQEIEIGDPKVLINIKHPLNQSTISLNFDFLCCNPK